MVEQPKNRDEYAPPRKDVRVPPSLPVLLDAVMSFGLLCMLAVLVGFDRFGLASYLAGICIVAGVTLTALMWVLIILFLSEES